MFLLWWREFQNTLAQSSCSRADNVAALWRARARHDNGTRHDTTRRDAAFLAEIRIFLIPLLLLLCKAASRACILARGALKPFEAAKNSRKRRRGKTIRKQLAAPGERTAAGQRLVDYALETRVRRLFPSLFRSEIIKRRVKHFFTSVYAL